MDVVSKVIKVRQDELKDYVASAAFKGLDHVPLSPYRVNSYLHNPRARDEDIVLYLLFKKGDLVSYRCILGDQCFPDSEGIHIGWFSGNWTHPQHRRKGYSSLLLKEVRKDWEDRLLFSNYAPASKNVLDQTEGFSLINVLKGQRYYFKFCSGELLPPKSSFFKTIKPLLSGIDRILNGFLSNKSHQAQAIPREKFSSLTKDDIRFITEFKDEELFRRTKEEYDWIVQFPWIQTTAEAQKWDARYYFSSYATDFDLSFYRIKIQGSIEGILMISIKDKVLKVQYAYLNEAAFSLAAQLLLRLAIEENVLHLTVYHKGLIKELNKSKRFYLFRKKFDQAFLTSKKVLNQFPEIKKKKIQKGDGDAVFT